MAGCSSRDLCLRSIVTISLFVAACRGIVSVQEYCDKFNNYSVRPIICLLRVNDTNNSSAGEWEEEEEEDCSCDVNCYPRPEVFIDLEELVPDISGNLPVSDLQCQPCGRACPINPFITPRCNCAAIGPSTSTKGPRCRCSVTCANPRRAEDPFCIYNVTQISRIQDSRRVYNCECDKSRAARDNPFPDFTCICQPDL